MIRYNYNVIRADSLHKLVEKFNQIYGTKPKEFKGAHIIYVEKNTVVECKRTGDIKAYKNEYTALVEEKWEVNE